MKKTVMSIVFILMGILVFSLPAMASEKGENIARPCISISPNGGSIAPNSTIIIVSSYKYGVDNLKYRWDDNCVTTVLSRTALIYAPSAAGSHTLWVRAECNTSGHKTWAWKRIHINIVDTLPPTISVSPNTGALLLGDDILIAPFDSSSRTCKIYYAWDKRKYDVETITVHEDILSIMIDDSLTEGTHKLHVKAVDESGNSTGWRTYTYRIIHKF